MIYVARKLSSKYLQEVRKRAEAATSGPWVSFVEGRDHSSGQNFIRRTMDDTEVDHDLYLLGDAVTIADQDFIAHARQDIPILLDEIARLQMEVLLSRREIKGKG